MKKNKSIVSKMINFSNKKEKILLKTQNKIKEFNELFLINWEENK